MSYGQVSKFVVSMASDVTLSAAIDLQKAYNKISLGIPSMLSGTDIYVRGAGGASDTYRRINHPPNSVSSVAGPQFIGSAITQCIVPLNHVHVRYLKIELSTAMTASPATFEVICSD